MGLPATRTTSIDANWLMEAMARMMRPLISFTVGRISCNALVGLVREIYVDEARAYLERGSPDRKVTYSSLALLSGLDVRAIKAHEQSGERVYRPSDVCSEAAILELWRSDDSFVDPDTGEPAELLLFGPKNTFESLVHRAAGRGVTAQTALERLVTSGNVSLNDEETHVRLEDYRYMPIRPSDVTAIESGSFAINRLGRSILHNSRRDSDTPPHLQQDRWSTSIPADRVDEIRDDLRRVLERHIKEIEEYIEKRENSPANETECAVGVGWYYWEDPLPPEAADPP